jgi:predicted small lipoprotein YifL
MVARFAVLMVAVAALAGCGQKGPLYLPDKGGEVVTRPGGGQAQQQAPQSQPSPASSDDEQRKKDQQSQPAPRN